MSEKEEAGIMAAAVIFGGSQAGFSTNPDINKGNVKPFIEINGEKLVCIAQGGECRYNHKFYSLGLNDTKSWTTPIIDESCPNRCYYKVIVCDDHEKRTGQKCEGSIEYYPWYNKFNGLFGKYCRNFDKFGIKDGNDKKVRAERSGDVTIIRKNRRKITWGDIDEPK